MKKILSGVTALALSVVLAGCFESTDSSKESESVVSATEVDLGLQYYLDNPSKAQEKHTACLGGNGVDSTSVNCEHANRAVAKQVLIGNAPTVEEVAAEMKSQYELAKEKREARMKAMQAEQSK